MTPLALQPQRNIQEVVFGPYQSRRFGVSLGVNPLPRGARLCNFDCVYCECVNGAWSPDWELRPQFPDSKQVRLELVRAVQRFGPDDLDSITICGNGEPTLSRNLNGIIDAVNDARDYYWPQARTVILTNGSMCHRPQVCSALAKLDERVVKLDAGTNWMLDQLNRPSESLSINELVWRISIMPDIIIQSMFVRGPIDNTEPRHVNSWIETLQRLRPLSVQIYSLDREPARAWVEPAGHDVLRRIADQVEGLLGIPARVY